MTCCMNTVADPRKRPGRLPPPHLGSLRIWHSSPGILGPPASGSRKGRHPPEPAAAFGAITAHNGTRVPGVTTPRFAHEVRPRPRPRPRENGLAPRHAANAPQTRHRNLDASSTPSLIHPSIPQLLNSHAPSTLLEAGDKQWG